MELDQSVLSIDNSNELALLYNFIHKAPSVI